jgi:hypothetical protein
MIQDLPVMYKNREFSYENDVENTSKSILILPLITNKELISNEDIGKDWLFYFVKVSLIIFGIVSICLIIVYAVYTYYYKKNM